MNEQTKRRLRLSRETVRQLTGVELKDAVGGGTINPPMNTANTCPVSACVCITGFVCREASIVCD